MSVFDQLCQAAIRAEEKGVISPQLAERVCAIGKNHVHYKHLGLELHGLIAQLAPAGSNLACAPSAVLEELVQQVEGKHRRP
jgi:hypothetical protein